MSIETAEARVDPRVRRTRRDVRRVAGELLRAEGLDAVTHSRVAAEAGYSRATMYTHWPRPIDLLSEAFRHFGSTPHHERTGDLRADLIGELTVLRSVLVDEGLGRVLSTVAERAVSNPELAGLRDLMVAEGTRILDAALIDHMAPDRARTATTLAIGSIFYLATMTDDPISDQTIAGLVDQITA
ncbi:MAG: TetR family transcriptional regulator [Actinomycetota bacterium]